jgi:hypothetical protein
MKTTRFDVFSSVMIAVVTILSALTAWRANATAIQVGDADFDGTAATIRTQEARIYNSILAFEHYRAFTDFYRYNALGDSLFEDQAIGPLRERSEYWGIAHGLQYSFFNSLYLDPAGDTYDVDREIEELQAEANLTGDLNFQQYFDTADAYRTKSANMNLTLIVFAVSFFLFAVGQAIRNSLRYLFAIGGLVALLGGTCAFLVLEFSI